MVGAARVLHRRGGQAAVAVSVGVAGGVPIPAAQEWPMWRPARGFRSWAQARATNYWARPRSGRPLFGEALAREG